jgi:hypothetical protein
MNHKDRLGERFEAVDLVGQIREMTAAKPENNKKINSSVNCINAKKFAI